MSLWNRGLKQQAATHKKATLCGLFCKINFSLLFYLPASIVVSSPLIHPQHFLPSRLLLLFSYFVGLIYYYALDFTVFLLRSARAPASLSWPKLKRLNEKLWEELFSLFWLFVFYSLQLLISEHFSFEPRNFSLIFNAHIWVLWEAHRYWVSSGLLGFNGAMKCAPTFLLMNLKMFRAGKKASPLASITIFHDSFLVQLSSVLKASEK